MQQITLLVRADDRPGLAGASETLLHTPALESLLINEVRAGEFCVAAMYNTEDLGPVTWRASSIRVEMARYGYEVLDVAVGPSQSSGILVLHDPAGHTGPAGPWFWVPIATALTGWATVAGLLIHHFT